jgi:hypothetical protein
LPRLQKVSQGLGKPLAAAQVIISARVLPAWSA